MTDVSSRKGGYYLINQKEYPSVTTILKIINKPALQRWGIRRAAEIALNNPEMDVKDVVDAMYDIGDDASNRGSLIHGIICGSGEEAPEKFNGYLEAYNSWRAIFPFEEKGHEITVHSEKYGYAGTLDLILKASNNDVWIVDFKTGGIYSEASLQIVAYKVAYEECFGEKVDKTGVVQLKQDGSFSFEQTNADFEAFLAAKKLWEWWRGK